ncbi:MAG: chemotaxis protein CheD [Spirochaetales bacterium]|nr:chemotaxis protein CheD [Spirochaetales bacterium]
MKQIYHVGIGAYAVHHSPAVLKTVLGSCVGVLLYHFNSRVGGLAHVYLPNSKEFKTDFSSAMSERSNFADVLIPQMINAMGNFGADLSGLQGFVAGGATMTDSSYNLEVLQIGKRNLQEVRRILNGYNIPFRELDVGGRFGKVITCDLETGEISLRKVQGFTSVEDIQVQDF